MHYYWIYLFSIPLGFLFTSHFLHYKKRYFWYEYAAVFLLPSFSLFLLYNAVGLKIFFIFLFWSVAGPLLEALVGKTYLGIRGRHLWIYQTMPIFNRTTSWLSVPFWAFAGLGIWAMNRVLEYLIKF